LYVSFSIISVRRENWNSDNKNYLGFCSFNPDDWYLQQLMQLSKIARRNDQGESLFPDAPV
jgi:hypothetical protein